MRSLLPLTIILGLSLSLSPSIFSEEEERGKEGFRQVAFVQSKEIDENSGLAFSYRYKDAVWTHNDSGGTPHVYLVSTRTGETLAKGLVLDAKCKDWEDVTTYQKGGKSYLVVADVGDNDRDRGRVQLAVFPEPELDFGDHANPSLVEFTVKDWAKYKFEYEDGPRNCESVGVDTELNQIILFEKMHVEIEGKPGAYVLDLPGDSGGEGVARRIGDVNVKNFTSLDISRDGRTLVARSYFAGYRFDRAEGESWKAVLAKPLPEAIVFPFQKQGEGLCIYPDTKSILISSEKKNQPLWQVYLK